MKERVGDEKLIIISVAARGINDHIRLSTFLGSDSYSVLAVNSALHPSGVA